MTEWIKCTLINSTFAVRINDTNGTYFVGGKGLKQGDPHSPLLFNLVADVFTKMLKKAASQDLISGLLPNIIPGGVVSLQYAEDTILFFWRIRFTKPETSNGFCHVSNPSLG